MPDIIHRKQIPVKVDKSHLITIGEKLYTEKSSFIRELVNNAYDADACEVRIDIQPSHIIISDNGSGMDEDGLRQYFTIGSSEKRSRVTSPRFARKRIGEFGISKFSALSACKRFEIETQRGDFHARLVFDKATWSSHEDWHLDIDVLQSDDTVPHGTTITLHDLDIAFAPGKVRRYLAERTPIHAPDFVVYINDECVTDEIVSGVHHAVHVQTSCGDIGGVLVIRPLTSRTDQGGIAVSVNGVLIRYEWFGLDMSRRSGAHRIAGRVNADFFAGNEQSR